MKTDKKIFFFRLHRGSFKESMETVVEISSKESLIDFLKEEVHYRIQEIEISDVSVFDHRNGWNTHNVAAKFPDGFFRVVGQLNCKL